MGVLIEVLALRYNASNELRVFLATGILGGYTTFSAFSLEFATLYERNEMSAAFGYVLASVVLSLFRGVRRSLGIALGYWQTTPGQSRSDPGLADGEADMRLDRWFRVHFP